MDFNNISENLNTSTEYHTPYLVRLNREQGRFASFFVVANDF